MKGQAQDVMCALAAFLVALCSSSWHSIDTDIDTDTAVLGLSQG